MSRLVVHIVTALHQDNVIVIPLLDNVPMDVDHYRTLYMSIGTLETDVIFTSVSKVLNSNYLAARCRYLKRSAFVII